MPARFQALTLTVLSLVAFTACGAGAARHSASVAPFGSTAAVINLSTGSTTARLLSSNDLATQATGASVFSALMQLRPRFLRTPVGGGGMMSTPLIPVPDGGVAVFVNGGFMGGIDALHGISARHVAFIRHYPQVEALHRFGRRAPNGAIEIRLLQR